MFAQHIDWLTLFDYPTSSRSIHLYDDGDILLSGFDHDYSLPFLSRIDSNGEVLWTRSIGHLGFVEYFFQTFVLENGNIVVYNNRGNFMVMDSEAVDSLKSGIIDPFIDSDHITTKVQKSEDEFLVYGVVRFDTVQTIYMVNHNPTSGEIENEVVFFDLNNVIVSNDIYISQDTNKNSIINYRDLQGTHTVFLNSQYEVIWSSIDPYYYNQVNGIKLIDNGRYFKWGHLQDTASLNYPSTAYIQCNSSVDNSIIWKKTLPPEPNENFSTISSFATMDGGYSFFVGMVGSSAIIMLTDVQYGLIDAVGNVSWKGRTNFEGLGDWVSDVSFTENDEFLISGTTDRLDHYPNGYSFVMKVRESNVGVDDLINARGLAVYPNPANEQVTIELNGLGRQTGHLSVFDQYGRQLLRTEREVDLTIQSFTLDIRTYSAGLYTIRWTSGEEVATELLVITE